MKNKDLPIVSFEISALGENNFTGIANVVKELARQLLADDTVEGRFFVYRSEVPRELVEKIVELDGCGVLWWMAGRLNAKPQPMGDFDRPHIGIYPSSKIHRRLFPVEVQIVYDLTTVVTPQYHDPDAAAYWNRQLPADMLSSDLLVMISESTRADVQTYFPETRSIPSIVAPMAPCVAEISPLFERETIEPYILILGTLEPRKNVELVFEYLAKHPGILQDFKFVFVGRWGWGRATRDMLQEHGLTDLLKSGRMVFTGFVADETRDQLISNAKLVIYPSRYEGFGLPVIEALHYGVPVITSYSTSMPEAGGDAAYYCDVDDPESLHASIVRFLESYSSSNSLVEKQARKAWAHSFSWNKTYRMIRDAALACVSQ